MQHAHDKDGQLFVRISLGRFKKLQIIKRKGEIWKGRNFIEKTHFYTFWLVIFLRNWWWAHKEWIIVKFWIIKTYQQVTFCTSFLLRNGKRNIGYTIYMSSIWTQESTGLVSYNLVQIIYFTLYTFIEVKLRE